MRTFRELLTFNDWLKKETFDECINRLKSLNISKSSKFEEIVNIQDFSGVIDCVDIDNNNESEINRIID